MRRIFSFLKFFRRDLAVLLMAAKQPGTPGRVRVLFLLTILYLLSPIDLIPDTIPVVGVLDDAVLVPAAVCALLRLLPPAVGVRGGSPAASRRGHSRCRRAPRPALACAHHLGNMSFVRVSRGREEARCRRDATGMARCGVCGAV